MQALPTAFSSMLLSIPTRFSLMLVKKLMEILPMIETQARTRRRRTVWIGAVAVCAILVMSAGVLVVGDYHRGSADDFIAKARAERDANTLHAALPPPATAPAQAPNYLA